MFVETQFEKIILVCKVLCQKDGTLDKKALTKMRCHLPLDRNEGGTFYYVKRFLFINSW